MTVTDRVKTWWPIALAFVGFIVVYGNLPKRVDKVEAGQEVQDTRVQALEKISSKLDGYIEAQQQMNERLANQSTPAPRRSRGLREWEDEVGFWCCASDDRQRCFDEELWTVCD